MQKRIGKKQRFLYVLRGAQTAQIVQLFYAGNAELVAYFFIGYAAAAERGNLIEQRIRVAEAAGGFARYPIQRFVVRRYARFRGSLRKQGFYLFHRTEPEVELLTAAFYRRRHFVKFRCRENKNNVGRRLFNRF